MSHRPATSTHVPAYQHLHRSMTQVDSSSDDDDIDPRWTSKRLTHQQQPTTTNPPSRGAARPHSPTPPTSTSDSHRSMASHSSASSSPPSLASSARSHHPNFPRRGYTPTPNPLDTSVGTNMVAGRTTHSAKEVEQQWKKGMGDIAQSQPSGSTRADGGDFSAVPAPEVDLTGMTEEQRELIEYYQARIGQHGRYCLNHLCAVP